MSGFFRLKSKTKLTEITPETKIVESDFALCEDGYFIQLEYVEEETNKEKIKVKSGIFTINKGLEGLKLESTSFSEQKIYTNYNHTDKILTKINNFFSKVHIYKKYGISPAKRGVMLYGPAGTGKTAIITEICNKYKDNETLVVLWQTDKYDAYEVKEFIKRFDYVNVSRLILIAEDIGGVEIDQVKKPSESSLLALLDNSEKAFTIPTLTIATTNFPEIFLENLTKRPGRFDDLIEIPRPTGEERVKLYNFLVVGDAYPSTEIVNSNPNYQIMNLEFSEKKFDEFSIAHIKEIVLRSELYDLTHLEAANQILGDIKKFNNMFQKKKQLGIVNCYDD